MAAKKKKAKAKKKKEHKAIGTENTDKRKEVFKNEIKERRDNLNLTQKELAKALGVNTPRVSEWECGARVPKRLTQIGIFAIMDCLEDVVEELPGGWKRKV